MVLELRKIITTLHSAIGCNIGTLSEMIKGIYCISSGGVTQENISRWTGRLGSYRSLQRMMHSPINWLELNLLLLKSHWLESSDSARYCIAVDEVVSKKAGKKTYGVSWFFSSIAGKPIRSISFHAISLVDTKKERSFALHQIQNIKASKEKAEDAQQVKKARSGVKKKTKVKERGKKVASKKKAGRPKGSKNKQNIKEISPLSQGFKELLDLVHAPLAALGVRVKHVLADGAYGNKTCVMICMELGLCLVSKLNRNSVLYLPYTGAYAGVGAPQKYGEQLMHDKLPAENLKTTQIEKDAKIEIYQFKKIWSKNFPQMINVVILQKTNLKTNQTAQVILFSSDLELEWDRMLHFYGQRFQIEFNFRDAKQYFGLADLKNTKEQSVKNSVGMAFFMGNLSLILIEKAKIHYQVEDCSVQDIKAIFRAEFYLNSILNTIDLPNKPLFNDPIFDNVAKIGAVNLKKTAA
jgi:putative transposase